MPICWFLAALAAANADTWATEIGSALGGSPRTCEPGDAPAGDLRRGQPRRDACGAGGGGSDRPAVRPGWPAGVIVTAAGWGGALGDSLLGAFVQAQWRDSRRAGRWTERPQPGPPERGQRGVGNDAVNLLATLLAVCLAAVCCKNKLIFSCLLRQKTRNLCYNKIAGCSANG